MLLFKKLERAGNGEEHRVPSVALGIALAVVIGAGGGLGAVFFRWLIYTFQAAFFGGGEHLLSWLGPYYVVLLPAVGGYFVGLIVRKMAPEARGHGVPEVMLSIARQGGRIRPRVAVAKTLASALCIGSGGSAGREGPIVQIGSALGSSLGQWLRLPANWTRTLVGCGAAAGISGTFNAPLGGCLFTMELLTGKFATGNFALVVISSVAGNLVAGAFLGPYPAFAVGNMPSFTDVREMFFYMGLGVLTALVGVAFKESIDLSEDLFEKKLRVPEWTKPVLGGLVVGLVGLYSLDLLGVGYGRTVWRSTTSIDNALAGTIPLQVLLLLVPLKILATSTTIGSGGSGGIFAPSLFLGAMTGSIVGSVAVHFFPGAPMGCYALVGSAALFAGVARAPITSIVMVFELTRNYALILPVMIAVVVSTGVVRLLSRETIYTAKLMRRGIDILGMGRHVTPGDVSVADVMTVDFPTVPPKMTLAELANRFVESGHHGFPVLEEDGTVCGIVTLYDLRLAQASGLPLTMLVADICSQPAVTAEPGEMLGEVLSRVAYRDFGRIPVVDPRQGGRLVGVLRRASLLEAWRQAME
jgi:CIC family chloride channel protein